jgi:hypothetical protein
VSNGFVASSYVTSSVHEGGVVFFHSENGRLFSSNHTGAAIWNGIKEGLPVDAIARQISDENAIDFEIALTDVERFIDELSRRELIART